MAVVIHRNTPYYFFMDFETSIYIAIGKNVRKYRQERGISQEKLSELLNANSKFVGHVERFERYISLKKLIQISEILCVPLSLLVKID